jgi:hypothetical protein
MIGFKKRENSMSNIEALKVRLTDDQIRKLEDIKPFDIGFPLTIIHDDPTETGVTAPLVAASAQIAWQPAPKPVVYGR